MQTISSSDARNHLSAMLDKVRQEPLIIQKQGRNAAVLIAYDDYMKMAQGAAQEFQALCDQIGRNARARGLTDEVFDEIMARKHD